MDWLLVLGAGASTAAPCNLPVFTQLRDAAMRGLGWEQVDTWNADGEPAGRAWARDGYPQIAASGRYKDVPAEVVFGALHRFSVGFAPAVERLTTENLRPNAIHHVAAALLRSGAPVWTPNIDTAVELAHAERYGSPPHRVCGEGRLSAASDGSGYQHAANGTLVKFHGSADVRESLAFADLELLTPLSRPDVGHLCSIAAGRRMVLYGYAGADADLRGLLAAAMRVCREIAWFEMNDGKRKVILQTFPDAPIVFFPRELPKTPGEQIAAIAADFLALADESGLCAGIPEPLLREFGAFDDSGSGAPELRLPLPDPPGIVHVRLIERFGDPRDEGSAVRAARREDLLRLPPRAVRQHVRWAGSRSLYGGGLLARTTKAAMRAPWLLRTPGSRRARDFVYTFGPALLLADGAYERLHRLADRAVRERRDRDGEPLPADLYYRAHALRYLMRLADARRDAEAALSRLVGSASSRPDAERLAGAILENGILDLYAGRFTSALGFGRDLASSRGRYAIRRWEAWGHWLCGVAFTYQCKVGDANEAFVRAYEAFRGTGYDKGLIDVAIGHRLLKRVASALGPAAEVSDLEIDVSHASSRQHSDLVLLDAEAALAEGDLDTARRRLTAVLEAPPNAVAAAWARLGEAEIRRFEGEAAPGFATVRAEARAMGARWLEAQAIAGMVLGGELSQADGDTAVRQLDIEAPEGGSGTAGIVVGDPRVLWMIT